ncbi:putative Phosphatidylinositol alpha-mannosyltransferase [Nitrospira japonica]|uniref:Putative Phosphatidylinositol alpha-mannosyltransferase n=1 Tax=Nitrospira japonica TaxID=1325564 RepID=A0A1W1HZW9_9BACT|nr:glycosyltransferase family 4 protein [Nitrospira japonica]SLM46179.1 putative Phosphatidylinositol alpha-mannosyltransferase [Nitrospira japonica]
MNLFISESSTAVGGQELAVLLHAEGLVKRGHRLRLILEPGSPIAAMAQEKGLPVTLLSMRRNRYPQAIVALRGLMYRERPAILQVNSSRDSWIGCIAVRLVKPRPKIIRIRHISTPLNRNMTTQLLYRRLLDMVVVTGGERTRRDLIERDGLEPGRVAAFPIGLDVAHFRPGPPARDLRRELGLPATHLLVGIISYLRTYKGHEYFIEAAGRIAAQRDDVTFVIVGEGPEEQSIRRRIEQSGAAWRIRLLGFRDDLLDVFRSLDVFAIPSVEGDTIPQVLMQALALGIPVVSTTIGSIPDVVIDGQTGYVVPPRDGLALADRIAHLLGDAGLRSRLGANGRALVEGSYSIDKMLDRMEAVYQSLAQSLTRSPAGGSTSGRGG